MEPGKVHSSKSSGGEDAYLRSAWYPVAWSSELVDGILPRRIAGEPVLLYRQKNGTPAAMFDRCPHRFAPLSRGCIVGDYIRCGYHGLTFDAKGGCIANPLGEGYIPETASVRAFPTEEKFGLVWIWRGDHEKAEPKNIPDLSAFVPGPTAEFKTAYIHVRADYRLAIDNLMDLSHSVFLHAETLAPVTPGLRDAVVRVSRNGERIKATIEMKNIDIGDGERRDQQLDTEWFAPGVVALTFAQVPHGELLGNEAIHALHIITPETERSSHYLFGSTVDGREGMTRDPFVDEDEPMLAACQERMGEEDFWSLRPVILPNDAAAIQVRRQLEKMIRNEQASQSLVASARLLNVINQRSIE